MDTIKFKYEINLSISDKWNQVVCLLLIWDFWERRVYWQRAVKYVTKKFAIMFNKETKDYIKWLKEMTDKPFKK